MNVGHGDLQVTRRGALGAVGGSLAALLVGCGARQSTYRQKITVVVDTPDGVKSGFSVVEVGSATVPNWMENIPGNGFFLRGEAVAVDVALGKTLFALLAHEPGSDKNWYQAQLITDAINAGSRTQPPLSLPGNGYGQEAFETIAQSRVTVALPESLYPLLVTFSDPRDAMSVARIDARDLSSSFGPGVVLRSITVSVTTDGLTRGMKRRLAPLGLQKDAGLSTTKRVAANLTLAERLGYNDFIYGIDA